MKKLNIGCGNDAREGYVNLDVVPLKGVDVVHDLNKFPYPFEKDLFDEILCSAILEHLDDVVESMNELGRILKPGGILKIRVPHFTSSTVWKDPTHKRGFSIKTFDFFVKKSIYSPVPKFKTVKRKISFGKKFAVWNYLIEPMANTFPLVYETTPLRIFPALSVVVYLRKL